MPLAAAEQADDADPGFRKLHGGLEVKLGDRVQPDEKDVFKSFGGVPAERARGFRPPPHRVMEPRRHATAHQQAGSQYALEDRQ